MAHVDKKSEAVQGGAAHHLQYIQHMKKVVLVFPDTSSMVDFLLIYKVNGVEANSVDLSIGGQISEKLVTVAVSEYGAEIVEGVSVEWK
jgi:hypothetical protein